MKNLKTLAIGLAAAASLALSAPAALADGYQGAKGGYKPAYAPVYNWSGLYFGGSFGWASVDADYLRDYGPVFPTFAGRPDFDNSGWIGGGHVGIQHQFGNIVAGVEVSLSGGDLKDTAPPFGPAGNPNFSTETIDISWIFTATAKLGFVVSPDWMVYVKGGYASAHVVNRLDTPNGNFASGEREHGWTVGVGFDYMFMKNIMLGLEYNYMDLGIGDRNYRYANNDPANLRDGDLQLHTISARLTFLLGRNHDGPAAAPLK